MTRPTYGRRWMLAVTLAFLAATPMELAAQAKPEPSQTAGAEPKPSGGTPAIPPASSKSAGDPTTPGTSTQTAATAKPETLTSKPAEPASGTDKSGDTSAADKSATEGPPGPQPPAVSLGSRIAGWTALLGTTGILVLFGYLTFQLVGRFTKALDNRLAIGTRSHWGAFGGGESGWEVTPALAVLLAAVVLAIATTALGSAVADAAARLLEGRPPAPLAATAAAPAAAQKSSTPAQ